MDKQLSFGLWLRQRRKAQDLTQQGLADRVGCSWETIRKIEDGTRRPSRQIAELLAEQLGVQTEERAAFVQFARTSGEGDVPAIQVNGSGAAAASEPAERRTPNNLPAERTPFIGRRPEVERLRGMLIDRDVRLLTLTGPPGIGKTRLSLEIACEMLDNFPDGVYFIALAPVADPELVAYTIAQTLGVKEVPGQSITDTVKGFLGERRMLLVLDNFEHVVVASPLVTDLLTVCPNLKALTTSREVLHVYSEHEYPVPPMALPPSDAEPPDDPAQYEAVRLFVEHATAVRPDFALNENNIASVVEICRKVDGLPLAIELAAARVKILSPQALLARMDHRLHVLTGGAKDLPPRQQTLRNAIEWSFESLKDPEKALFRRLGVFAGGCTMEAAEQVCAGPGDITGDFLDRMGSLVDKSLLRQTEQHDGEWRFFMLETIREYALEKLEESGEEHDMRVRHAEFFMDLAEDAAPNLTSAKRTLWLSKLDAEIDNMRAVLTWSQTPGGDPVTGLKLAGALGRYWYLRNYANEGRKWLDEGFVAATGVSVPLRIRARALYAAGLLRIWHSDYAPGQEYLEESVALWRETGDERSLAWALTELGVAYNLGVIYQPLQQSVKTDRQKAIAVTQEAIEIFTRLDDKFGLAWSLSDLGDLEFGCGEFDKTVTLYEQALALFREVGDVKGVSDGLAQLGRHDTQAGEYDRARRRLEEALELQKDLGDKWQRAHILRSLGDLELLRGNAEKAVSHYTPSLQLFKELGDRRRVPILTRSLGNAAQRQENYEEAYKLYRESLSLYRDLDVPEGISLTLAGLAAILAIHGEARRGAELLGIGQALANLNQKAISPLNMWEYEANVAIVRSHLSEAAYADAVAQGLELPKSKAMAMVWDLVLIPVKLSAPVRPRKSEGNRGVAGLSEREIQVLRLLVRGLTNNQIAEALSISPRTIGAHLYTIYNKIGVKTRIEAAQFARDNGIV
jgi:predicted ATPase/DNA-binding CsgD family transcriptional regulator/DNA-binding XRE family transcriptional regulator